MMMDTSPPPVQQSNMMAIPPPNYGEAVSAPVAGAALVYQKPLGVFPDVEFGSEPVQLSCWSCHREIVTDVTSQIKSWGWCFAITCCLVGSWIVSCLVGCLPGFRRFTHRCPLCRALLGEGEPKHSGKHIALIIFLSLFALGITGLLIYLLLYFLFLNLILSLISLDLN